MCALRGRQPGGRLKSRLFCVTSFRTRVSTPCAVMRLSTVYLLLTDGFANAGVIYGQTPEKPVESRNLRLERLHLTLPKIEYPMLCWSIKMLEISLSNITTQHRIVEVLSSYASEFMDGRFAFDYSEYSRKNWAVQHVCCELDNVIRKLLGMLLFNRRELERIKKSI